MSFTHVDCHLFRGQGASSDTSSFVTFNPSRTPGSLVAACSSAAKESLGSQVACKLALEHFSEAVLHYFDEGSGSARDEEISVQVLEVAFRNANNSVYQFGHKLAAGGRMAASLVGLVLEESTIAAGRVGSGSAYLYRTGSVFPFFDVEGQSEAHAGEGSLIGTNSLVSVELASVSVEAGDVVLLFSERLDPYAEEQLGMLLSNPEVLESRSPSAALARNLFVQPERVAFVMCAHIGPDTIFLSHPV